MFISHDSLFCHQESNYQKQIEEFRSENSRLSQENTHLQAEVDRLQALHKSAKDSSVELDSLREHVRYKNKIVSFTIHFL